MGWFDNTFDDKKDKKNINKEKEPPKELQTPETREYKIFKEEEFFFAKHTLYEKACAIAEKILKISPDKKTGYQLDRAIKFTHLKCTKEGVTSLASLFLFFWTFLIFFLVITKYITGVGISLILGGLIFIIISPFAYYLYKYPLHLKKKYEIHIGSEIVMLILYMVIYMKDHANLEGALDFSAKNLRGPLSYDIRKLLWDIEVGVYKTPEEALIEYASNWRENKEFVESIQTIISSLAQTEDRRIIVLDQAMNIILNGTRERVKRYSYKLKMPIMVVNALGITLPIMGLVMFPVIAIFLSDIFKPIMLFVGYDVLLPVLLFFIIVNILETRPVTFSKIDISDNPSVPAEGKFNLKLKNITKEVPAWPFAIFVASLFFLGGLFLFTKEAEGLIASVLMIAGINFGIMVYNYLLSFQLIKIRKETREIEGQFAEALFQLGNRVSSGAPIEIALERSVADMENLTIKNLFKSALSNMQNLGLTFEGSFFDRKYGAIKQYPSKLIKSVMRSVIDSSKKGVQLAATSMLNISRYLRDIHETQEEIEEEMGDIISSLKFQAFFLSPLVSGVVVTTATIIIRILNQLHQTVGGMTNVPGGGFGTSLLGAWGQIPINPGAFQLIVGLYLVETLLLLSMFISGIETGEDKIAKRDLTASILLIGFIVYIISLGITLLVFGPMVAIGVAV